MILYNIGWLFLKMVAIYCEYCVVKLLFKSLGQVFFIFQGCIELIKTDSKYIYNVIKDFLKIHIY